MFFSICCIFFFFFKQKTAYDMRISDWSSDVCSSDLTLAYDDRDNRIRPTRGQSLSLSQDFAGLGGSVKYVRTRLQGSKHFNLGSRFILNISAEGGYLYPFGARTTPTSDQVRLTDRFLLLEPQVRGLAIPGVEHRTAAPEG